MTLREEILNLSESNYNLNALRQKYILKIHNEFISLLDCNEEPSAETIAKRLGYKTTKDDAFKRLSKEERIKFVSSVLNQQIAGKNNKTWKEIWTETY